MQPALTELGRYQLIELLGRGGMAEVYKARLSGALGINRLVAVKRMLPEARRTAEYVELFIREARVCSRMMHPNLIQIFELGQTDAELFLAMELVEGPDLRKVLNANQSLGRTLPLEFAICIANGVLRGLDAAHRLTDDAGQPLGVVHRDLSPANVLLSYEGAIKVADFGVAHSGENKPIPADAGKIKGKLQYMAPEQIVGGALDARVDVFAAAAVLYEMVSGRELYPWTDAADVVQRVAKGKHLPIDQAAPGIDPQLAAIITRGLAAEPADRFPSCDAFASDLARLVHQGRLPCAPESELALYLQVLTPKQPLRAELVYTPQAAGSSPALPAIVASAQPTPPLAPQEQRSPTSGLKPVSSASPPSRPAVAPPPGAFAPGARARSAQSAQATPGPASGRPASGGTPSAGGPTSARPPSNPALVRPAPSANASSTAIKATVAKPIPAGSSPNMKARIATPVAPPPSARPPVVSAAPASPPAPRPAVTPAAPPAHPAAEELALLTAHEVPPRPMTGGDLSRPNTPTPGRPDTGDQLDALLVSFLAGETPPPPPAPPPVLPPKPAKGKGK